MSDASDLNSDSTMQAMAAAVTANAMPLLVLYDLLIDKGIISREEALSALRARSDPDDADSSVHLQNSVLRSFIDYLERSKTSSP